MKDSVTVIGSLNYDMFLRVKRLPEEGETMTAEGASFAAGGKGANQAVQAAKLGVKTYLVGCVGDDAMGGSLVASATRYGLDLTYLRRCEESTGMGVVHALEDGRVHATIIRGANYAVTKEDVDRAVPALEDSHLVILQMEIPQEVNAYAAEKAKACGCRVLMNAAPAAPFDDQHIALCDIMVVNEVEAAFYCGEEIDSIEKAKEQIQRMAENYHNSWIFTLGSAGSVVCDGTRAEFIPSKKVDAVESTGAGDSYIGGVAYALGRGMDLFEASRFATCCSAVTVCRVGAQDSMPTLREAEALYRS